MDYIINFNRVNELTTVIYDKRVDNSSPFSDGQVVFTLSRSITIFQESLTKPNKNTRLEHVIKTLEYNGILISDATIRDQKIDKILNT